jgi:hypothetical protein
MLLVDGGKALDKASWFVSTICQGKTICILHNGSKPNSYPICFHVLYLCQTTANLPTSSRVLRLLSSEPVYGALSECRRREWASFPAFSRLSSAREAVDAIHHLSSQLLALAAGGQARQL